MNESQSRAAPADGTIRVGTSGYSFADWKGTVYPAGIRQDEMLSYYEQALGFDAVEVNASYYRILSRATAARMAAKTSPGFEFVVKAYRGTTHDPFDDRLGGARPAPERGLEDLDATLDGLAPLRESGKLGAVLFQFPVFFAPSEQSYAYLRAVRARCGDVPAVVEFRNRRWATEETWAFLRDHELGFCAVDEPPLPRLMPFAEVVSSPVAYVRFHGCNPNWFNAPPAERYHYRYSDEELRPFVPAVRRMASAARRAYVFFNNCHLGHAAHNAAGFRGMLGA